MPDRCRVSRRRRHLIRRAGAGGGREATRADVVRVDKISAPGYISTIERRVELVFEVEPANANILARAFPGAEAHGGIPGLEVRLVRRKLDVMGDGETPSKLRCYLVSDLHGEIAKYERLFTLLQDDPPEVLFLAGDLLPSFAHYDRNLGFRGNDFVNDYFRNKLERVRRTLGDGVPDVCVILGNDDARFHEASFMQPTHPRLFHYVHDRRVSVAGYTVVGYACVPPSPFHNKDWERYDVSRYVDPGCVSPEEGYLTVPRPARDRRYTTIARELDSLTANIDFATTIMIFHSPPYDSALDRAALDGASVDGVPLDVHIGSIAIRRLIEQQKPRVTLHGHVHEAYRLTGRFKERIGATWCLSAADDSDELVVVEFDAAHPGKAIRRLVEVRRDQ